jgi:Sec-independent protein secretion pathway component TatC
VPLIVLYEAGIIAARVFIGKDKPAAEENPDETSAAG